MERERGGVENRVAFIVVCSVAGDRSREVVWNRCIASRRLHNSTSRAHSLSTAVGCCRQLDLVRERERGGSPLFAVPGSFGFWSSVSFKRMKDEKGIACCEWGFNESRNTFTAHRIPTIPSHLPRAKGFQLCIAQPSLSSIPQRAWAYDVATFRPFPFQSRFRERPPTNPFKSLMERYQWFSLWLPTDNWFILFPL